MYIKHIHNAYLNMYIKHIHNTYLNMYININIIHI
jgi:hypothetical protein